MENKKEHFFDQFPSFYETGKTGASHKELNERFYPLIEKNLDILKNSTVLDIGSHDGRWSFAALKNGANKVIGIEGKEELVELSKQNMQKYGIDSKHYEFIQGDITKETEKIPSKSIDIVFCLGVFYHITNHMELLRAIKKLQPKYLIMDTEINNSKAPIVRIREEPYKTPDKLIDYTKFVAGRTSKSALNMMLKSIDFSPEYFDWGNRITDWKGFEIYSSKKSILLKRGILYALSFFSDKKKRLKRRNDLIRYFTTKKIILIAKNKAL